MSDIQDKLNQILSNPEALKQVQSLGEQLGLNTSQISQPPAPPPPPKKPDLPINDDMLGAITKLAPLMNSLNNGDDDITRLLRSLRPFLGSERQAKLDKAEKMLKMLRLLPIIRENGIL